MSGARDAPTSGVDPAAIPRSTFTSSLRAAAWALLSPSTGLGQEESLLLPRTLGAGALSWEPGHLGFIPSHWGTLQ